MKEKHAVHADLINEPGKVVPACGKTFETGLQQFDVFIHYKTFDAFVCGGNQEKCEDCAKDIKRRAA